MRQSELGQRRTSLPKGLCIAALWRSAGRLTRSRNRNGLGASLRQLSGLSAAALLFSASQTLADPVSDFHEGKTVAVSVGFAPGGGCGFHSRLLTRYMARDMPGAPTVIVRNKPGAGGFPLPNSMYNSGVADGPAFAAFNRLVLDPDYLNQAVNACLDVSLVTAGKIESALADSSQTDLGHSESHQKRLQIDL